MTEAWLVVILVGVATIGIKSIGPFLLGGRDLPPRIASLIGLLAPALLAALVAINTFGASGRSCWTSGSWASRRRGGRDLAEGARAPGRRDRGRGHGRRPRVPLT